MTVYEKVEENGQPINLSKLDFKFWNKILIYSINSAINLPKLDFKYTIYNTNSVSFRL